MERDAKQDPNDLILNALKWVTVNAPRISASMMRALVSNPVTTSLLTLQDRLGIAIEDLQSIPFSAAGRRAADFFEEIRYHRLADPSILSDIILHFEPEDDDAFRRDVKILLGRRLRYDTNYKIPGKSFEEFPDDYFKAFGPQFD